MQCCLAVVSSPTTTNIIKLDGWTNTLYLIRSSASEDIKQKDTHWSLQGRQFFVWVQNEFGPICTEPSQCCSNQLHIAPTVGFSPRLKKEKWPILISTVNNVSDTKWDPTHRFVVWQTTVLTGHKHAGKQHTSG